MKAQILQVDSRENKKTGEISYDMTVLSDFVSYGVLRPSTVQVKLDSTSFAKYSEYIGKTVEIDVLIPLPDYPLYLR